MEQYDSLLSSIAQAKHLVEGGDEAYRYALARTQLKMASKLLEDGKPNLSLEFAAESESTFCASSAHNAVEYADHATHTTAYAERLWALGYYEASLKPGSALISLPIKTYGELSAHSNLLLSLAKRQLAMGEVTASTSLIKTYLPRLQSTPDMSVENQITHAKLLLLLGEAFYQSWTISDDEAAALVQDARSVLDDVAACDGVNPVESNVLDLQWHALKMAFVSANMKEAHLALKTSLHCVQNGWLSPFEHAFICAVGCQRLSRMGDYETSKYHLEEATSRILTHIGETSPHQFEPAMLLAVLADAYANTQDQQAIPAAAYSLALFGRLQQVDESAFRERFQDVSGLLRTVIGLNYQRHPTRPVEEALELYRIAFVLFDDILQNTPAQSTDSLVATAVAEIVMALAEQGRSQAAQTFAALCHEHLNSTYPTREEF